MVSSLAFAAGTHLSAALPQVTVGSPDLGRLISMGGSVQYVPGTSIRRPLPLGPPSLGGFRLSEIPDRVFTEETIKAMHRGVLAAKTDAEWRDLMEDIRAAGRKSGAVGWKDYLGELRWFDHWFRDVYPLDYVRDPHQVELVRHPWLTVYKAAGDCVPLEQKIIVRQRASNRYAILPVGELSDRWIEYDAVSYSEPNGRFEFAPITNFVHKGKRPILRVRSRSGYEFMATPDHRVSGIFGRPDSGFTLRYEPLQKILSSSRNRCRGIGMARKLPALHSMNTVSAHQLYVEGIYAAEGYSERPNRCEISNKSDEIISRTTQSLDALGIPYRIRRRKDGVKLVYVKASYLSRRLSAFGRNSETMGWPEEYLSLSQEDIRVLISAYAAGDGYYPKKGCRWQKYAHVIYNTQSARLKDQLCFFHLILGEPLSPYLQKNPGGAAKNPKPMWRVIHRKPSSRVHVERLPNLENSAIRASDAGEKEVCDITVGANGNFITQYGHVLHNCDDLSTAIAGALGALGAEHRFRTYKADPFRRPGQFTHVTAQIKVPGQGWVNEDLTLKDVPFGFEPQGYETKDWPEPRY